MSGTSQEFNINPNDTFYISVKTVFYNWTALKLAVSHNFGGSDSKETAEWFLNATYQWIVDNSDLEDFELEDFLFDTMNNEFNTILDDGSCLLIARLLLKYNSLYRNGKLEELNQDLCTRYSKVADSLQTSYKAGQDYSSDEDEDGDDVDENNNQDEPMEQEEDKNENKTKNLMTQEESENFEKLEEGWTFVTKTGKHITK